MKDAVGVGWKWDEPQEMKGPGSNCLMRDALGVEYWSGVMGARGWARKRVEERGGWLQERGGTRWG